MHKPVLVLDENIPGWEGLETLATLRRLPGREMTAADVVDADALMVRSVTRVDATLLAGSRVGFVGTATIGTDHLDTAWLDRHGIRWASAPGCNANAVVDYVCSAIGALPGLLECLLDGGRVGIVGYGNVGRRLHQRLAAAGIRCVAHDPLLSPAQCPVQVSLEAVCQVDLLCLHAPLTREGAHPSWHMFDARRLHSLPAHTVLLNAGRGGVVDNAALLASLAARPRPVVLDVWENEPAINAALLASVTLGTPHIAGYSVEGKLAGTRQIRAAYGQYRGLTVPETAPLDRAGTLALASATGGVEALRAALMHAYDIRRDDQALRRALGADPSGAAFDALRKYYPERREFSSWLIPADLDAASINCLQAWGFGR